MGISRAKDSNNLVPVARYKIISPDEVSSYHEVLEGSHYKYSWYDGGRKNELFHVGGGSPFVSESAHVYDYGTYTLIPQTDFVAMVHMWGGGGGGYSSGDDTSRAGGGGFTQAMIRFKANIPYALVIGQAGRYGLTSNTTTHGGGGGSYAVHGGQGGGLTGIFFNSDHRGRSVWAHSPPLAQSQALAIAGGGGGAGHHNSPSHHGPGGGGGGWNGRHGHACQGGGQYQGGYGSSYGAPWTHSAGTALHGGRSSQQGTYTGGGGGGWFGGGGGGHSSSHYNGGAGGSGHHAYKEDYGIQANNKLSSYVLFANTETAAGSYSNPWQYSANFKNPLAYRSSSPTYGEYDGYYAGKGGRGNTEPTARSSSLHGKIVITLVPDVVGDMFRNKGVSSANVSEWMNQDDYTKD